MRHSLRVRLIVSILAFMVPASAAAGWLLVRVFADRLLRDIDVAVAEEADTVAALLLDSSSANMLDAALAHISSETDLGVGKQIVVRRAGTVIGESPTGAAAMIAARAAAADVRIGTAIRGAADKQITVQIAVPAAAAVHAAERLSWLLALAIPCGVLVLTAGQWFVIGRTLRPLEAASQRIEAIGVLDLTTRIPIANRDDEIGHMVQGLNRLLDRVARSVEQMQRFTADAAHELRTPLTVLRAGLEVTLARQRSADEYRTALGDALAATQRLSALSEDLLALARLDRDAALATPMAPIEVTELLQDLADAWQPRASERGIGIDLLSGEPLTISGRAADLYRLLSNLIDNAVRHGPAGSTVGIEARRVATRVEISVSDDGPGISAGDETKVLSRFYRGRDEATPGFGLGLSIAQMIARAHGGDLRIGNRAEGGCVATVMLPGPNA